MTSAPDSAEKVFELAKEGKINLILQSNIVSISGHGHLQEVTVMGRDKSTTTLQTDYLIPLFGLSPKLGPIANWGLDINKRQLSVDTEKFQTNMPGIYAVGDINHYAGKKKLILSGFHEAALAAFAIKEYLEPGKKVHLQYTTTSPLMHKRLGVESAEEQAAARKAASG